MNIMYLYEDAESRLSRPNCTVRMSDGTC